jgi:hypothetical protein
LYSPVNERSSGELLGCTRFSAELLRLLPDAIDECVEEPMAPSLWSSQGPRGFRLLSERVASRLRRAGLTFHAHTPDAEHFHDVADLARSNLRRYAMSAAALRAALAAALGRS